MIVPCCPGTVPSGCCLIVSPLVLLPLWLWHTTADVAKYTQVYEEWKGAKDQRTLERRQSYTSIAPAEVAKYMQLFQEQKAAKDRQMLERKATLTRIRKDIDDLRSRMCSILEKAPKLRPLVDVRNCRWRYTKPGNIPDVGVSAAVSTTRTGSGILAETREEIQDLIAHQRRIIKNYIALTGR
ncbi:hypothetical protein TGP89_362660, partial [Toxoplasma gondii p89]